MAQRPDRAADERFCKPPDQGGLAEIKIIRRKYPPPKLMVTWGFGKPAPKIHLEHTWDNWEYWKYPNAGQEIHFNHFSPKDPLPD